MNKQNAGFTLIELLVAMGIVAVLTGMAAFNLNQARMRARDVQRKSDLDQLQKAMEVYKNDNFTYPASALQDTLMGLPTKQVQYIKKYFNDPKGAGDWVDYLYIPSADFKSYYLMTCLENPADPARATDTTICAKFAIGDPTVADVCKCGHFFSTRTGSMYIISQP